MYRGDHYQVKLEREDQSFPVSSNGHHSRMSCAHGIRTKDTCDVLRYCGRGHGSSIQLQSAPVLPRVRAVGCGPKSALAMRAILLVTSVLLTWVYIPALPHSYSGRLNTFLNLDEPQFHHL